MTAAYAGHISVVEILLKAGANVNSVNEEVGSCLTGVFAGM
jgi:ankyrin repeat protein